tara:strand:- start:122 stop:415 length:294 start_codon:yes stop_codon:yes gene_type:complete
MKKQIKVTLDEDLYNLISKKCKEELGEINLSLYTRILYTKHIKKTEILKYKRELKKIKRNNKINEMKKLRSQGLTYAEIGKIYSMSRQGIQQKIQEK